MSRSPRSLLPAALENACRRLLRHQHRARRRLRTCAGTSPAPRVINVTRPAYAIRKREPARIRQRRTALRVTTVTHVPKAILVRPGSARERIPSPARRAINVMTLARAIHRPELVQIRQRQMALRVATAMLVRKPIRVSQACALEQI